MYSDEAIVGGKRRQPQGAQGQSARLKLQKREEKNLYLVLDDWDKGFTIRKIDVDAPDLSEPPVVRLVSPAPSCHMFFASMGTHHILAMSNRHPVTLVYDTDTAGIAAGPLLPDVLLGGHDIFVPAADNLFAIGHPLRELPWFVEVLSTSSSSADDKSSLIPSKDWSWRSVVPSPFTEGERIRSYAVHPDGCTVFVSTRICHRRDDIRSCTFSFNTDNGEWRSHGDWELPFEDQGYFDSDLDAWVGLHKDGYIGTCQVASRSGTATTADQLDWKMAKDKLWNEEKQATLGPTLTCMGNARFCLVDSVDLDDGCMLQITTFRLRHSRKGELQIIDRNTTSCPVSKHHNSFSPIAFWM